MRKLGTLLLFLLIILIKLQAQTCFTKNWTGSGVDQMNLYISKAKVNNIDLQIGDEIGIFDGSACVGVGVLTQTPLGGTVFLSIVASNDDVSTPTKDGFTPSNVVSYKLCINGGNLVETVDRIINTLGDGKFAPSGTAVVELSAIIDIPTVPLVGTITQTTCAVPTGSVVLSGLPAGTWTLTRTPGGTTTVGTGTSTTISGLAAGTYTYTVTNASGLTSLSSGNVVINTQPSAPTAPVVGTITQPTCSVATGSIVLSGLPTTGTWTLTRTPGAVITTGTGTSTTITGLTTGTYTYKVTNAQTCISGSSANVVISIQPATPTTPVVGTITQPTCRVGTGSVVMNGLPSSGTWTLTRTPGDVTTTGTGFNTTTTGISAGTYSYTVANASGCISASTGNFVINAPQAIPTVSTGVISNASGSTASGGGEITHDGGAVVIVSGVCWSTAINPTTGDSKSSDGSTIGSYSSTLSGLTNGVTYHIRAYATNCVGTAYGADIVYNHILTDIESIKDAGIVVFPNPVSAILNIEYVNDNFITIRILNSFGGVIGREIAVPPQQHLDFSVFEPGLYILEFVKTSGEISRIKVIKSK